MACCFAYFVVTLIDGGSLEKRRKYKNCVLLCNLPVAASAVPPPSCAEAVPTRANRTRSEAVLTAPKRPFKPAMLCQRDLCHRLPMVQNHKESLLIFSFDDPCAVISQYTSKLASSYGVIFH